MVMSFAHHNYITRLLPPLTPTQSSMFGLCFACSASSQHCLLTGSSSRATGINFVCSLASLCVCVCVHKILL